METTRSSPTDSTGRRSAAHVGGRGTLPECYRDMSDWPGFDDAALEGKDRRRYGRLRDATALYLQGRPLSEVLQCAQISERRFLRVFSRCFERDRDGRILGCRAFVKNAHVRPPVRRAPFAGSSPDGKAGFSGMFRQVLDTYPGISDKLVTYLNGYGLSGLRPNRVMFRSIHKRFLDICKEEGIRPTDYPLNTRERARRSLRSWIDTDYLPRYASRFLKQEVGSDAADLLAYGTGSGTADRPYHGYGAWLIDAASVDLHARYEVPNDSGDWESLALRRFQHLRCIHKESSANLACRQVYAAQVSAEDVSILIWDALNGPPTVPTLIAGVLPELGAGYPAMLIPQLRFAVPSAIYLDNALAHLADHVQHIGTILLGCRVIMGRPKTPKERAAIESKFALQARRVVHKLPSTTGTGPLDPVRSTSEVAVPHRIRADELEQVIDVYVQNENALPAAGAHNVAPLERLRRLIASGALKPIHLPADKRKPYYFSKPVRVTVKVSTESGRSPYINYLYQRYSSPDLAKKFALKDRTMYIRADFRNLRTIMLFYEDGTEFGPIQALGHWGTFPHDVRIRKLYGRLKREGQLDTRADDRPLEALFAHLRAKAPRNSTAALQLTYLIEYLKRSNFVPSALLQEEVESWVAANKAAASIEVLPMTVLPALPATSGSQATNSQASSIAFAGGMAYEEGKQLEPTPPVPACYVLRRRSIRP